MMNNEPVAWIHKTATSWVSTFIHPETESDEWIPLYTHPANLTDEEIISIADDPYLCNKDGSLRSCIDFARAILRKAQE